MADEEKKPITRSEEAGNAGPPPSPEIAELRRKEAEYLRLMEMRKLKPFSPDSRAK